MSLIYEVNINVEKQKAVRNWLKEHMEEMLECEGFKKAFLFEHSEGYVVHYFVDSQKSLQNYLHGPKKEAMRALGLKFFESRKVEINRRILVEIF